jgi:hypothetical protein
MKTTSKNPMSDVTVMQEKGKRYFLAQLIEEAKANGDRLRFGVVVDDIVGVPECHAIEIAHAGGERKPATRAGEEKLSRSGILIKEAAK